MLIPKHGASVAQSNSVASHRGKQRDIEGITEIEQLN
jgi:hypothetical protein